MHFLIVNRWGDSFAAYDKYIDHEAHQMTYLVNANGRAGVETYCHSQNRRLYELADLADIVGASALYRQIVSERGRVDRIVALSEYDLLLGASLRSEFGVEGYPIERILAFRDKVLMKAAVAAAGVRVPRFCDATSHQALLTFAAEVGYSVIVKPRRGAASQGVSRATDAASLTAALEGLRLEDYQFEEYVEGPIFHIDGLQSQGRSVRRWVSQYVNTCLGYARGEPLGSFMVDNPQLTLVLERFSDQVLQALGLTDGPYHLEVILAGGSPVFLEIGARVGGAEIPFLLTDLYKLDIFHETVNIELGSFQPESLPSARAPLGGWLLLPAPAEKRCRVTSRNSLVGTVPTLYRELLPAVGDILSCDDNAGYEKVAGRFRYAGVDSASLKQDILRTINGYRLEYERI